MKAFYNARMTNTPTYIDCDKPVIPLELVKAIQPFRGELISHFGQWSSSSQVLMQSIESVGKDYDLLEILKEAISPYLEGCRLTGWHLTCPLNAQDILAAGLTAQNADEFKSRCELLCNAFEIDGAIKDKVVANAMKLYSRDANRQETICLYSSRVVEDGFLQYADCIGGETFRWAVESCIPTEFLERLGASGTPLAIKFSYHVTDTHPVYLDRALLALVKGAISMILCGECSPLEFDSCITKSVPPSDFITVIELKRDAEGMVFFDD